MRIDVVTIFPEYLEPLGLSLPGKARESGLLDVHVHDLRDWTHDRHRTVDDTPVRRRRRHGDEARALGRGAGRRRPGRRRRSSSPHRPVARSRRPSAAELAGREHLVFACGRYEGIDQRVIDDAASRMEVREVSIGDYVLNGGEVAALAIIEAVVRLLPGFMGNAESLSEESFADGLLEYPVYTKPASWRGHDVPDVLLSGDHARIAAWRHDQSVRRTAERRPDLAHASRAVDLGALARGDRASRPPPTPPRCSRCSARAGSRSSRPTPGCTSRPCTRTSPTCRHG